MTSFEDAETNGFSWKRHPGIELRDLRACGSGSRDQKAAASEAMREWRLAFSRSRPRQRWMLYHQDLAFFIVGLL